LSKDEMFLKCVEFAKIVLTREIIQAEDAFGAEEAINSIYQNTKDKRIIVLDKHYSFEHIFDDFPELLFIIYPREADGFWGIRTIGENSKTFVNRKNFQNLGRGCARKNWRMLPACRTPCFAIADFS